VRDRIAPLNSLIVTNGDKLAVSTQRSADWYTAFAQALLCLPVCLFEYRPLAGVEDVHVFPLSHCLGVSVADRWSSVN